MNQPPAMMLKALLLGGALVATASGHQIWPVPDDFALPDLSAASPPSGSCADSDSIMPGSGIANGIVPWIIRITLWTGISSTRRSI